MRWTIVLVALVIVGGTSCRTSSRAQQPERSTEHCCHLICMCHGDLPSPTVLEEEAAELMKCDEQYPELDQAQCGCAPQYGPNGEVLTAECH